MKFHRSAACAAWTALVLSGPALMAESPAPPMIVVGALYPGANATVVADTVAAPIEQQLHGLDGVIRLVSRAGDDGTYMLSVIFRPGIDLDQAKSAVQNRLALAHRRCPKASAAQATTLAAKQPIRAVVCLTSPMSRHEVAMMSGMANQLKNDLADPGRRCNYGSRRCRAAAADLARSRPTKRAGPLRPGCRETARKTGVGRWAQIRRHVDSAQSGSRAGADRSENRRCWKRH